MHSFVLFFFFSHSQIKHSSIKVPYKHRVAGTRKTGNTAFDLVLNESVSQVVFAGMKRTVKRNQKLICKLRNAECYNWLKEPWSLDLMTLVIKSSLNGFETLFLSQTLRITFFFPLFRPFLLYQFQFLLHYYIISTLFSNPFIAIKVITALCHRPRRSFFTPIFLFFFLLL